MTSTINRLLAGFDFAINLAIFKEYVIFEALVVTQCSSVFLILKIEGVLLLIEKREIQHILKKIQIQILSI